MGAIDVLNASLASLSLVGILFLAMLLVPNLLWMRRKPEGYTDAGESAVLRGLERFGQAIAVMCLLFMARGDPTPVGARLAWLVAAFALMFAYEMYWTRYFRGAHALRDFYGRFLGVPVPGAVLPVAAMLCLSLYRSDIWLALAAVILGIGHIGIHVQHARRAGCL